uniref:AlNc14C33G2990 protein n=1 Tax=Albugo laibachii Nc14 TaxID=890382 RepID=F0W896_9STRA|nr:AlNc14C33G2990 [Albugo laibachii Nc14]|eukprot:CCA17296.1 AlNc14C33G2990 [Albugo laibachii Nc14]
MLLDISNRSQLSISFRQKYIIISFTSFIASTCVASSVLQNSVHQEWQLKFKFKKWCKTIDFTSLR